MILKRITWPRFYISEVIFWVIFTILTFIVVIDDLQLIPSVFASLLFVLETFALVQINLYLIRFYFKEKKYFVYSLFLIFLLLSGIVLIRQTFFWVYGEKGSNAANLYFILVLILTSLIRVINDQKKAIIQTETTVKEKRNSFFVQSGTSHHQIYFNDILFIKAEGNYLSIHTVKDSRIMVLMTMKDMIQKLPEKMFSRIHKSYIVFIPKIKSVEHHQVKIGDQKIPIGSHYRSDFMKQLELRESK